MPDTIPHLAFPLTITAAGRFQTADQDSDEEIVGCVETVLLCPKGHRDLLPDFGLPPVEFTRLADDRASLIRQAVARSEPRASKMLIDETITDFTATLTVQAARA